MIIKKKVPRHYLMPIKLGIAFSLLTLFVYEFGVIDYPKFNNAKLLFLVLASNLGMYLGFSIGVRKITNDVEQSDYNKSVMKLYRVLFWVSMILCVPRFIIFTGQSFSINGLYNGLIKALTNPLQVYQDKQSLSSVGGILKYVNYIIVLCGGLLWAYVPMSVLLWKRLKLHYKVCCVIFCIIYILQYLMVGTNTGLFNIVFEIVVAIVIRNMIDGKSRFVRKKKKKNTWKSTLLLAFALVLVISIFAFIMGSRMGDQYLNKTFYVAGTSYSLDKQSILWILCPESLRSLLVNLNSYVAIGYIGLDLTLSDQLTFHPTFGAGFSRFICDNLSEILNFDIYAYSYLGQLEEHFGYSALRSWCTMYAWWASDVGFVGIPFVLFFLTYGFGRAWKTFIVNKNEYAFLFFFLIVRFFIHISANNQVFMQYDTLMAFIFALIGWQYTSKKRNRNK